LADNKIQVKRTSVTGRTANVTSSGNSQFIDAGEFALNMADGILYTSNGSTLITVGSNLVNQNITGNLTVNAIIANGSLGVSGQVLATNSTGVYWSSAGAGSVTSISSGDGLTGGPITNSGTLSVLANNGIIANSAGVFVNTAYIGTLTANAFVGINVRTFTATGQSPYIPTTGMKHCLVIATGGGGGGGGSDAADTAAAGAGAGGGAGGTAIKYYTAAQIGANNAAFAIGASGTAGGSTGTDGGAGGTTTFTPSNGGAALSAAGGALGNGGGQPTTGSSAAGGVGGTPTGGDFNIPGGDGNGGAGHTDGGFAIGGIGGSSFWGGAGRGATDTSGSLAGQAGGTNTGGGGGGAATVDSTTGAAGGAGGAGVIFILEFI